MLVAVGPIFHITPENPDLMAGIDAHYIVRSLDLPPRPWRGRLLKHPIASGLRPLCPFRGVESRYLHSRPVAVTA